MDKSIGLFTILETLIAKSDKNHPISRKTITKKMLDDHGVTMERRCFYRVRALLDDLGFPSEYDEKNKGYYLNPPFLERGEELMIWNAIHAARFLSQDESRRIITKLNRFCSEPHYNQFTQEVYLPNPKKTTNNETLKNIEVAEQAILARKKMSFYYMHYDHNLQLVRKDNILRIVEPRYIVYQDSRPYLIVTGRKENKITHYRLDKISEAHVTSENASPNFKVEDAYAYANNKLFMFSGEMIRARIKCKKSVFDSMIDIFGTNLIVFTPDPDHYEFAVTVNRNGLLFLAQQFLDVIEITYPEEIRKELLSRLEEVRKKYL